MCKEKKGIEELEQEVRELEHELEIARLRKKVRELKAEIEKQRGYTITIVPCVPRPCPCPPWKPLYPTWPTYPTITYHWTTTASAQSV